MFSSFKKSACDHKARILKTASIVCGLYIAKHYISDRLGEVKARLEQDRAARDSLHRRFQQTQDDVSFTVMALLSTLGDQILENMDVEAITSELQARSKTKNARQLNGSGQSALASTDLASSFAVVQEHEVRSPNGPASVTSTDLVEVDSGASIYESSAEPQGKVQTSDNVRTKSTMSDSNASKENVSLHSSRSEDFTSSSVVTNFSAPRTKAELWNEVKMLTITRTLTTLYSTTLLCLFTTVQLTLLARAKYVKSVLEQERDERLREQLESELSLSKILFDGGQGLASLMSQDFEAISGKEGVVDEAISEDVESKYLTLSWWLLHVGWKDVGERVKRGVEEVFDSVSLKTKLNIMDLHRLVGDVRRRVEHEITFEGTERRINFISTLLPPTPEMVQHVLTQGGFPSNAEFTPSLPNLCGSGADKLTQEALSTSLSSSQLSNSNYCSNLNTTTDPFAALFPGVNTLAPSAPTPAGLSILDLQQSTLPLPNPHPHTADKPFTSLFEETRSLICSSDFMVVLENCLDRAVEVLLNGLEKDVFVSSEAGEGEEARVRFASLLPGLSRWSSLALKSIPCELVDNVLAVRELPCLSAITFAKFEDKFR